jgi:hypothetical protein
MVGATGFEPATSSSQSWRSTRLSYAPTRSRERDRARCWRGCKGNSKQDRNGTAAAILHRASFIRAPHVRSKIQVWTSKHRRAECHPDGWRTLATDTSGAWVTPEIGSNAGKLPEFQAWGIYDRNPVAFAWLRSAFARRSSQEVRIKELPVCQIRLYSGRKLRNGEARYD